MNYRTIGLLALSVIAITAIPAIAEATTVTSPTGTNLTGTNEAKTEGHIVVLNPIAKLECNVKMTGQIVTHGAGVTVQGVVTEFGISSCTNFWHATTAFGGTLEAHYISGYNATITASGGKIAATRFGVTCTYVTNKTDLGTATGGNPTTMHISASLPVEGSESSALCGSSSSKMEGAYVGSGSAYYDA